MQRGSRYEGNERRISDSLREENEVLLTEGIADPWLDLGYSDSPWIYMLRPLLWFKALYRAITYFTTKKEILLVIMVVLLA